MVKNLRKAVTVAVTVAVAYSAAGCSGGGERADSSPERSVTVPSSLATMTADPALGSITARFDPASPDAVAVSVVAPTAATEMQLSLDPTFGSGQWAPVRGEALVPVYDSGYVMIYARFRGSGTTTRPVVAGVTIDRGWAAATASAAGRYRATGTGLVSPSVIQVTIETGRVRYGSQEPYDFDRPVEGDQLEDADGGVKKVSRNGAPFGLQIGPGVNGLLRYDEVIGRALDGSTLDAANDYEISSRDDVSYSSPRRAAQVTRTSRPIGLARTADGDVMTVEHDLFVAAPSPLRSGATYTITFAGGDIEPVTFSFDDRRSLSPAVHINQLGYRPNDPAKVALVSTFTEVPGFVSLSDRLPFHLVDSTTAQVVFSGSSTRAPDNRDEFGKGDLTGSPVFQLDFSGFTNAGRYRVCVTSVGCSYDFAIDAVETWRRGMVNVARAMYHQRSGVALGEPFTSVDRPVGFNPSMGMVAHQTTASLMETGNGPLGGERFEPLVEGATDEVVPDAWGGHADAGDWDRRIEHLWYLRSALDLVELFPEQLGHLDLNIPESGDTIPDLIDEGLWDLDLYRRLQLPNGAIRGGVETDEHPDPRTTSWTTQQSVYVYAPDPYSSYIYAGVAAQAAQALRAYDEPRAATYEKSAIAAMQWAETQKVPSKYRDEVTAQRSVAAAALFRLTSNAKWHDIFLATTPLVDGPIDLLGCHDQKSCDSAWIYARIDPSLTRKAVRDNALESYRRNADHVLDGQSTTAFGWTIEHPEIPLVWGLGPSTPKVIGLLRAHALLGDRRYCAAAVRSAAFSFGANPLNVAFFTGLGVKNVRTPLIVDSLNGGLPYWPGTPVYGLHKLSQDDDWISRYFLRPAGTKPDPDAMPYLMSWYDLFNMAQFNEYTVFQSHAVALFGLGYLASDDC